MSGRRTLVAPDDLGSWLLRAAAGQAVTLFGATAATARAALAAAELPGDRRLGVVFTVTVAAPAEAVARQAIAALSSAVLAAYPFWYGGDSLCDIGARNLDGAVLEARLRDLQDAVPELSPLWARRAVGRAIAGRPPREGDLPLAAGLRQLALALNMGALTLVLVLERTPDTIEASATMLALEWLARGSGSAVVAVPPDPALALPSPLDRLPSAEVIAPDPAPLLDEASDARPAAPWAGPIEGRPHWASAAEQRLATLLAADGELGPLFAFNQNVMTRRGGRPRVDLLWRAGRLVVEIDGYADHTTREAFGRDRQRDYELTISGYLVLRLTAEEVLTDAALSLDKLRDAVRFRRSNDVTESA